MSSNYKSLGIRSVINANATLTKLGGSLMPAEVRQAMQDAAQSFVDMHDLQQEVGRKVSVLTFLRQSSMAPNSGKACNNIQRC